jgi:hypothetical protein
MEEGKKVKWYYSVWSVILALLCFGPFALPLLFLSPKFKLASKVLISLLVIGSTIWLVMMTRETYRLLMKDIEGLRQIAR